MKGKKDAAAVALAKKRWLGVSQEERDEHGRAMRAGRAVKMSPAKRKASAEKAAAARWAKPGAKKAAKKK